MLRKAPDTRRFCTPDADAGKQKYRHVVLPKTCFKHATVPTTAAVSTRYGQTSATLQTSKPIIMVQGGFRHHDTNFEKYFTMIVADLQKLCVATLICCEYLLRTPFLLKLPIRGVGVLKRGRQPNMASIAGAQRLRVTTPLKPHCTAGKPLLRQRPPSSIDHIEQNHSSKILSPQRYRALH